jgi:hypothetical protein
MQEADMELKRDVISAAWIIAIFVLTGVAEAQTGNRPANPVHEHIAHVMTRWNDTPDMKGLLPVAIGEAEVVFEQMERADLEGRINDFILYGGYVLHALDPGAETDALLKTAYARLPTTYVKVEIPGAGYGVKKAVAGALTHVQLAAKSPGASDNVKTHALHVAAALETVSKWTDEAIAVARKLISAKDVGDGQPLVDELVGLAGYISKGRDGEGGLRQAQRHMRLMMKGEGL